MNASDIIKRKQNGALYTAYNNVNLRLSDPNTRPIVYETNNNCVTYGCNDFINYELKNNVDSGAYVCGAKTVSYLTFTSPPKVHLNIDFYQGTNYTSVCK